MIGLSEGCCAFAIVREKHNAAAVPPSKRAASRRVRPPSGSTNEIVGRFRETPIVAGVADAWPRPPTRLQLSSNQRCLGYARHLKGTENEHHSPSFHQSLGRTLLRS